jgi:2-amino-4-hydroxy-6-hydroxymethyldihydropteridine diphosphokinase
MTQCVYLSLGSNLGDREANLRRAVEALQAELTVTVLSSLYETEPVGVLEQPAFLNRALAAATDLAPPDLLSLVKGVEREVGRRPTFRWGPRVVDVDIILYGDRVVDARELIIPHREMANRAFVLVPLAEIAPDVRHPLLQVSVADLLESVSGRDSVRLFRHHLESPPLYP